MATPGKTKAPYRAAELTITYPSGEVKKFQSIAEGARAIGMQYSSVQRYLRGEYKTCRAGYKFSTY